MRILVTWWAWFIWSHLCKKLISEWHIVFCLDNLLTWSQYNIHELLSHPNFTFIYHDITQPFSLQVDQIYHLACPASPVHYQKNPLHTLETCFLWTSHILDLALKTKARVLFSSTSEVYWDPHVHPQPEHYWWHVNIVWPRSCYDEGKRVAETLMMEYHKQYGVDIRIIRIFNTYWPYMHPQDGRVVSNFITQMIHNAPITVYGQWQQTRSFQYIDDLLDWMVRMMNNEKQCIWPVNLWSHIEFTILELVQQLQQLLPHSTSQIIHLPLPIDDPQQRQADNSLAKNILDREPTTPLWVWLQKTIDYFVAYYATQTL